MSFFTSVELLPEDPILGLQALFIADKNPNKVNLGVGTYKDGIGAPYVLKTVTKAEKLILDKHLDKEYLPISGNPEFNMLIQTVMFGELAGQYSNGEIATIQTIGGTGAMRVAGEFIARNRKMPIYIPEPSWANHKPVFTYAGLEIHRYPYYDPVSHDLDFKGMCEALKKIPSPAIVLFHACCHNPTGIDPNKDQWMEISKILKQQKLIPLFDFAYQGFGEGLDEDAFAVRHFLSQGHEMFVAQSCSKNFGLYGERLGSLTFISMNPKITQHVISHFKQIVRGSYSMPSLHGSRIVSTILQSKELTLQWKEEVALMRNRIKTMRKLLVEGLKKTGLSRNVDFFETQKGIFSYTGLTKEHVKKLRSDYSIFMTEDGRINVAGLNENNIQYVISSIYEVLEK